MTTKTLPSGTGVVSSYTYDNADRLTAISHVKGGSTTLASVAYTLDDVGNRTQRVDQQGTHTYAYDDVYRLTSVTYPGPATTSYTFDAFGNRLTKTDASGTTNSTYDDADRLTSVDPSGAPPAVTYTWDNNGNLTNRGSDTFAWDYEDRMTSATVGGTTTTFAYRGDGLRNSRTAGGNTTTFTWDIAAGLPVVIDDGKQYVYGAGLESMVSGGSRYYYLADGLGSTMAIVDSTGTVQKSYTYDVYGKPTATGTLSNEFDFAGQQTDSTGLQYLRARYMDPETGTFVSRDPLAVLPSFVLSPTGYVEGNPTIMTDHLGLEATKADKKWCRDKSRNITGLGERYRQCKRAEKLAEYAKEATKARYGTHEEDDSPSNAFQHCCWIGLIAIHYGNSVARGFGIRHETYEPGEPGYDDPLKSEKRVMDLHNNDIGAAYGQRLRDLKGVDEKFKYGPLMDYCQAATTNGTLINSLSDPRVTGLSP